MGEWTVTVGGKDYDVTAPDEKTAWKWANATHQKAAAPKQPDGVDRAMQEVKELQNTGPAELIAGSAPVRFALGAASPILGAAQLAANAVGQGEGINAYLQELERLKQRGMKAYGQEGTDWIGAGGAVMSPVSLGLMKLAPAASWYGRMGQGAAVGGGMGAAAPVSDTSDGYWAPKGRQVGTGVALGAALPAAVDVTSAAGRFARNMIDPALPGGTQRAASRALGEALGQRRGAVEAELRNPRVIVPGSNPTAAEAATGAGSAELAGMQKLAANRVDPSGYRDIEKGQEAARLAHILSFGKDDAAVEAARKARDAMTAPMRETALENANVAGRVLPVLEQRAAEQGRIASEAADVVRKFGRAGETAERVAASGRQRLDAGVPPVEGLPRVSGRTSYAEELAGVADKTTSEAAARSLQAGAERRFAEMQAQSLAQHGHFPLKTSSLTGQLSRIQNQPGNRTNTVLQRAMDEIKGLLKSAEDKNGIIDSRDLYTIRKSEIANTIKKFAEENKNWDQRFTASLVKNVQGMVDDAIERSGGTGWKDYLAKYAEKSKGIDEMRVGQKLADALRKPTDLGERVNTFAAAMKDEPRTLKGALGTPRYESLDEVLSPQNAQKAREVLADMLRKGEFEQMAAKGMGRATEIAGEAVPQLPPTGFFQPRVSAMRSWVNRAAGKLDKKSLAIMSEALKTPQGTLDLLSKLPPATRQRLVSQLQATGERAATIGAIEAANE